MPEYYNEPWEDGWAFGGWYTDETFTTEYTDWALKSDLTVYAKWRKRIDRVELTAPGALVPGNPLPTAADLTCSTEGVQVTGINWFSKAPGQAETASAGPVQAGLEYRMAVTLGVTDEAAYCLASPDLKAEVNGEEIAATTASGGKAASFNKYYLIGYKIMVDPNGGELLDADEVYYTDGSGYLPAEAWEALCEGSAAVKTNYDRTGWFTAAAGGTQITEDYRFGGDTTIYAQYVERPMVTVSFEMNGHGDQIAPVTLHYGEIMEGGLPTPTADGCRFDGWYKDAALTQRQTATDFVADTVLYARWTVFVRSVVLQHPDRETMIPGYVIQEGDVFTETEGVLVQHADWLRARASGSGLEPFSGPIEGGRTYVYHAHLMCEQGYAFANPVTVRHGGITENRYPSGNRIVVIHQFVIPPVAGIVTFDPNGGHFINPSDTYVGIEASGKIKAFPPNPINEGRPFLGWFSQPEGGYEITLNEFYLEDTEVFAHWGDAVINSITVSAPASLAKGDTLTTSGLLVLPVGVKVEDMTWYQVVDGSDVPVAPGAAALAGTTYKLAGVFSCRSGYKFADTVDVSFGAGINGILTTEDPESGLIVVEDHRLYDVPASPYTITFDLNGHGDESAWEPRSFEYDTAPGALGSEPEEEGWVFDGWYTDEALTSLFDPDVTHKDDFTLYAGWLKVIDAVDVKAPAELLGGESLADLTLTTDTEGVEALATTWQWKSGSGSWTDATGRTTELGCQYKATASIVITDMKQYTFDGTVAVYLGDEVLTVTPGAVGTDRFGFTISKEYDGIFNGYRITMDGNGGSLENVEEDYYTNPDGTLDEFADLFDSPVSRAGYEFAGWYTAPEGGSAAEDVYPFTENLTLYAHYTENPLVTVTFEMNGCGDQIAPVTLHVGESMEGGLPSPTADGARFEGWYSDEALTKPQAATDFAEDTTLYAKWTKIISAVRITRTAAEDITAGYTLSEADIAVEAEGVTVEKVTWKVMTGPASAEEFSGTVEGNKTYRYEVRLIPQDDYAFAGEVTVRDGGVTTTRKPVGAKLLHTGMIAVGDTSVKVIFNPNGGTLADPLAAEQYTDLTGHLTGFPDAPKNGTRAFLGWFDQPEGGNEATAETVFTEETELFAQWGPGALNWTVTFDPTYGTLPEEELTQTADTLTGKIAYLPTPESDKLAFAGWYTAASDGDKVTAETSYEADTTLYARWTVTVKFMINGHGKPYPPLLHEAGKALTLLPVLKEENYNFLGWYTDKELTRPYAGEVLNADTTLYALWEADFATEALRVHGSNRAKTSLAIANELKKKNGGAKFKAAVLCTGENYPDALAGGYLAAVKNAPILLLRNKSADRKKVISYIKSNVAKGSTLYILGSTKVVPNSWLNDLKASYTFKRLAGSNRLGTNAAILEAIGTGKGKEILVTTGYEYTDALCASAISKPLLIADTRKASNKFKGTQLDYIKKIKSKKPTFYIIGPESKMKTFADQLKSYGTVVWVTKDSNAINRSVDIADYFFTNPETVALATSEDYPDGLCGGVLAGKYAAPLLLTKKASASAKVKEYTTDNRIEYVLVYGSTSAVTDEAVKGSFVNVTAIKESKYN